MALAAGKLRHRIHIERKDQAQDNDTGDITDTWVPAFADDSGAAILIPASIEPLSGREFVAAQAVQSEITGKIVLRYRAGIDAAMRAVHGSDIYNIHAILRDPDSGLESMTLMVSSGPNVG